MRTHTSNFMPALKAYGRETNAIVTYQLNGEEVTLDSEDITKLNPYFNGKLFKTIMKVVEIESNTKIPKGTVINVKYGVKIGEEYEYIDFGDYYINNEPVYNADTLSYSHVAYDKMIESMIDYDDMPISAIYPITYKNFLIAICNQLNWDYDLTTFPNDDTEIDSDIYVGQELTYRDILDDLCPASMGNFVFNSNYQFTIKYPTETNETIDDYLLKDTNVVIGVKYGKVNALTLSRAEDGDIIYRRDEDSISLNGLTELKIKDNYLLSSSMRDRFIDDMFTQIDGLEFYTYDISTIGMLIFEPLDKFTISHDGVDYSVFMLNDDINITQGLSENCYVDKPEEADTDYSTSAPTDEAVKKAVILANKQKGQIELLTQQTEENSTNIASIEIDVNSINEKIEENKYYTDEQGNKQLISQKVFDLNKTVDGIDVQLTQIGGNNPFINPVGLQDNRATTDAYGWTGVCKTYTDTDVQKNTFGKSALFLQNGTRSQIIQVPNGTYTVSFLYKKLIELANCSVEINGYIITLDSIDWTKETYTFEVKSNTIEVKLISNTNDSCYVSDLMCNTGAIAQKYSSNATEVVTNNVKIGDGIEISSNASETLWKSNNDGTRIYDTHDLVNPVTEFTRQGTKTNELTANKATLAGELIARQGNQVWHSIT